MVKFIGYRRTMVLSAAAGLMLFSPIVSIAQADANSKTSSDPSPDLPKYDVATIKPTSASDDRRMFMFTPGGISLTGVPVQMLLTEAFHVEDDHIIGAPGWVKTNRYDVQAKVSPEDPLKLDKL